jgi:D-psicose/D-tagatose/L-ribulose 3-epimerase
VKLSCLETMLGDGPLAERFERARAAGFDGIDLRGDRLGPMVDEVRRLAERTGLEVPTVYGRLRVPLVAATAAERAQAMDIVRRRLRHAAVVGAGSLIVVPVFGEARFDLDWPGGVEQAELALLAIELRELAHDAASSRVAILLEPLNRAETHLLRSPAATAELARRIGSRWVATMADTYHMDLEGQDGVMEMRRAGDQLRLVHLSDRERRLPGEGGIDFARLLTGLEAQGYAGYLGFECRGAFGLDRLRHSVCFVRGLL